MTLFGVLSTLNAALEEGTTWTYAGLTDDGHVVDVIVVDGVLRRFQVLKQ